MIGLLATALAVPALAALPATPAAGAAASITINDPARSGPPHAGTVRLSGQVARGTGDATTVLYVVDATASTHFAAGGDCNGDGSAGGASDDLNGDGASGDVLDCEIGAVRKLNSTFVTAYPGDTMAVGVEAFAEDSALADLDLSGGQFAAPGDTGGQAQPRIVTAASSIQRGAILQYTHKTLGGSGVSFDNAIATALGALHGPQPPTGPKWIVLISDGQTGVADGTLAALHSSGVHLSSFAVGPHATCKSSSALAKMAQATGETCVAAATPAGLATRLTGAQPDGISGVTVTVGGVAVAADVDPVGGWSTVYTLGKGTYTASATASLTSGRRVSTSRTFSVVGANGGPPPGTVKPGPGALRATLVHAKRSAPTRTSLPARVSGSVGVPHHHKLKHAKHLEGATVALQARKTIGGTWTAVDRAHVKHGKYVLRWHPLRRMHYLRVVLRPFGSFAGSADAVPTPRISACTVTRHGGKFTMTCATRVHDGARARLLKNDRVVDRAKVRHGLVTVHHKGRPAGHVLVVDRPHHHHVRLAF